MQVQDVFVDVDNGRDKLFFPWHDDFVYRPTVALIRDAQIERVRPAKRVPAGRRGGWACAVEVEPGWLEAAGKGAASIVCLENGRRLWPIATEARKDADVVDLIHRSTDRPSAFDCGGFLAFLGLNLLDQLSLLAFCAGGDSRTSERLERLTRAILRGDVTILDARDSLLLPDGAPPHWLDRRARKAFHWLVWGGNHSLVQTLRGPSDGSQDGLRALDEVYGDFTAAILTRPEFDDYLARVALGSGPTNGSERWKADHVREIEAAHATFSRDAKRRKISPAAGKPAQSAKTRYPNVFASMNAGECGRRELNQIVPAPHRAGIVMYGPYWTLPRGHYLLAVDFAATRRAAEQASRLYLEVVIGNYLLGWSSIEGENAGAWTLPIEFDVDYAAINAFGKAIEFRLRTDGAWDGRVKDVRLERNGDAEALWSTPRSLLPLLHWNPAVVREESALRTPRQFEGHVFFGPYRCLPAGTYLVEIDAAVEADEPKFNCALEVIARPSALKLGFLRLHPTNGSISGRVRFELGVHDDERTLEFRLWKSAGGNLNLRTVALQRVA